MNFNHLRAFHLVATHGSYTAAAAAAGLSQPTLSEQVRLLQESYGVSLLRRTAAGMEATSKGEELMELAESIFTTARQAEQLLSGNRASTQGRLRFGADAPIHAVPTLTKVHAEHPGLRITLSSGNSAIIKNQVANGLVDVGIVADPMPHPLLTIALLSTQDLVAVVLRGSELAAKNLSIARLQGRPLVIRERGSVTRSASEAAMAAWQVTPSQLIEADSREAVEAAVLAGLGVGLMGEGEFSHDPRLTLVDFAEPLEPLSEFIIHRTDRRDDPVVAAAVAAALR
ncbi:LysR substrate-binding domain-containing protein [Arthrobacter sp. HLT1-20]